MKILRDHRYGDMPKFQKCPAPDPAQGRVNGDGMRGGVVLAVLTSGPYIGKQ
jgi:hypothetical protein